ncbi:VC2662 family protein [Celerinatantimonas sp. YJH-8]|uniref:VC2662 family protein n=1 Tax=Celerinatantimonas sp. YJH-8 TaxID=3228714 RepID=UPI0038C4E60D
MQRKNIIAMLTGSLLLSAYAHAAPAPVQLSLPGVNFPANDEVKGARFSFLYGRTKNVTGLDIPILSLSDIDNFTGVQFAPFLGVGYVRNQFKGVGIGLVNWHDGHDLGANIGLVNVTRNVQGLNLGAVNISRDQSLVDLGFVNYAPKTTFQLGLVNATQNLQGIQIGLVNYAANGVLPVMPIVNFNKSF